MITLALILSTSICQGILNTDTNQCYKPLQCPTGYYNIVDDSGHQSCAIERPEDKSKPCDEDITCWWST